MKIIPKFKCYYYLLLGVWLVATQPFAFAAIEDIQRLTADGNYTEALAMTNQELENNNGDITYRFLKGLILTRMDELEQARDVFIEITESHPDLPEPYNNLAVIYASMGDYDKARELLERAINTHPAYATAYENIGDIYAKLASHAYNQALELDRENNAARAKLSLVNDLFSTPDSVEVAVAAESLSEQAEPFEPVQVEEPVTEPVQIVEAIEPEEPVQPAVTEEEVRQREQELIAQNQLLQSQITTSLIKRSILDWAAAWSGQDVEAYLSVYASDFTPGDGRNLSQWQQYRRQRLSVPGTIQVLVSDLVVEMLGDEHAKATFTQIYQSDIYADRVKKTLLMKLEQDNWRITQEMTQ
ncbi:MAG: tetratricopeptide repeat protein [Gammaproteobacteria bacterium]|nr:tetratricopeptide repeat protein [Gammaproteobacteria bacterium]